MYESFNQLFFMKKGRESKELESICVRNRSGFGAFRSDQVVSKRVLLSIWLMSHSPLLVPPLDPIRHPMHEKSRETDEDCVPKALVVKLKHSNSTKCV